MSGKKRKKPNGWTTPVVVFRSPAEHRAIIQSGTLAAPVSMDGNRPWGGKPRRVRLAKAGIGTASLAVRMKAIGFRVYAQYLASVHWKDLRARWLQSQQFRGWRCHTVGCDSKAGLSLHHFTYERLGREELTDLVLVCRDCHSNIHKLERRGMHLDDATRAVVSGESRVQLNHEAAA